MDDKYKNILGDLRPSLNVNYGLKIQELENENEHLKIQIDKLRKSHNKQIAEMKKDKSVSSRKQANQDMRESFNRAMKKQRAAYERLLKAHQNKKKVHHTSRLELKFLENRTKEVYGRSAYADLINHPDNPTHMILGENMEKFLDKEKDNASLG